MDEKKLQQQGIIRENMLDNLDAARLRENVDSDDMNEALDDPKQSLPKPRSDLPKNKHHQPIHRM